MNKFIAAEELRAIREKLKVKRINLKKMIIGGTVLFNVLVLKMMKENNRMPFIIDKEEIYNPAIECLDENGLISDAIFKEKVKEKNDVSLSIIYETEWKKTKDEYEKIHYVYSYKNISKNQMLELINNKDLLKEKLKEEQKIVEHRKTIPTNENKATYIIELLNEEKSYVTYIDEENVRNLSDTILYLLTLMISIQIGGYIHLLGKRELDKQDLNAIKLNLIKQRQ